MDGRAQPMCCAAHTALPTGGSTSLSSSLHAEWTTCKKRLCWRLQPSPCKSSCQVNILMMLCTLNAIKLFQVASSLCTCSQYSWHHKSAYTHLHFCGFAHCCASPTDTCTSVIIPLGIAHQTLQPQLLRFLQSLVKFKFSAKREYKFLAKRLTRSAVKVIRNVANSCNLFFTGSAMC